MESVLEVYQTAYNPKIPVICIDEATKQLVKETLVPIPAEQGHPERFDYEYERNGTIENSPNGGYTKVNRSAPIAGIAVASKPLRINPHLTRSLFVIE
jgi:hypothetical protein